MQIHFFSGFQKRENSTKVPLVTDATKVLDGYLREPCSVMNPIVQIKRPLSDAVPYSYSYAYIGDFGRWYFVKDWVWTDGLWECQMKEDVLASFKTDIGNTTAYVERSASDYNGEIIDRVYPATTGFSTNVVSLTTPWYGVAPSGGCFVLGILTKASTYTSTMYGGAVTYYVMTPAQMKSLLNYLLSDGFLDDAGFPTQMTAIQQISHDTAKALVNPIQYISSCTWYPFSYSEISDGVLQDIQLGYYDVRGNHAKGYYLNSVTLVEFVSGEIPVHPQAPTRGKYLNYNPYTRLTMYVPPFGSIPIDTSFCEIGSYLHCPVYIDPITGKATLRVVLWENAQHTGNNAIVCERTGMFGVPIQLSQMMPADIIAGVQGSMQAGANVGNALATGVPYAGDLSLFMSLPTIGNAISNMMPQIDSQGVNGGFTMTTIPALLTALHIAVVDEDNTETGKPLCEVRTINTLSGYIKCGEATVDFSCFDTEKTSILSFMLNGFFWE